MLLDHRCIHRSQLGAGRFQIGAGRQSREKIGHPVDASGDHRRRQVMRAGDDIGYDLGFGRIRNRRLQHADDGRLPRAEANAFANYGRVALERGRPEPVGQHGGAGCARPVIMLIQQPSQYRMQTHY